MTGNVIGQQCDLKGRPIIGIIGIVIQPQNEGHALKASLTGGGQAFRDAVQFNLALWVD